jgi:hypothetical protein
MLADPQPRCDVHQRMRIHKPSLTPRPAASKSRARLQRNLSSIRFDSGQPEEAPAVRGAELEGDLLVGNEIRYECRRKSPPPNHKGRADGVCAPLETLLLAVT